MTTDPKRIIVTASCCNACEVHTIQVHHQHFPELRLEARSAEQAAEFLANRLKSSLDSVADPSHREAAKGAIDDLQAFLDRKGAAHPARDLTESGLQ